jgi:hypothetical protein
MQGPTARHEPHRELGRKRKRLVAAHGEGLQGATWIRQWFAEVPTKEFAGRNDGLERAGLARSRSFEKRQNLWVGERLSYGLERKSGVPARMTAQIQNRTDKEDGNVSN